jgi:hypothetical protein
MKFAFNIKPSSLLRAFTFVFAGFAVAGYILSFVSPETNKFINFHFLQKLALYCLISSATFNHFLSTKKYFAVHLFIMLLSSALLLQINIFSALTSLLSVILLFIKIPFTDKVKLHFHYLVVFAVSILSNQYSFMEHGWVLLLPVLFYASVWPVINNTGRPIQKYTVILLMLAAIVVFKMGSLVPPFQILDALPFIIIWFFGVLYRLNQYFSDDNKNHNAHLLEKIPSNIVLLNAAITAGFAGWYYGVFVFLLMPFSFVLFKTFEEQ